MDELGKSANALLLANVPVKGNDAALSKWKCWVAAMVVGEQPGWRIDAVEFVLTVPMLEEDGYLVYDVAKWAGADVDRILGLSIAGERAGVKDAWLDSFAAASGPSTTRLLKGLREDVVWDEKSFGYSVGGWRK